MSTTEPKAAPDSTPWWRSGNLHFAIATILLATLGIGWTGAMEVLQWATRKSPVPWPESVRVDSDSFRNLSLPTKFGPFERAQTTEDLPFRAPRTEEQEKLDLDIGELVIDEEIMEPLEIGTRQDRIRVEQRRSNWYVSRLYVDRRKAPTDPLALWQMSVYYYTGVRDQVPHVGEVCLAAGGATIIDTSRIELTSPGTAAPWGPKVPFHRTQYEHLNRHSGQRSEFVQYHTFNINGRPETDRLAVRSELAKPWVRHCFFAKIEFGPRTPISDSEAADRAAEEFIKYMLPEAIRALPTQQDIERLDARDGDSADD
jgi:hypothetical protein